MRQGSKRSMGQHFLHDANVADKIVQEIMASNNFDAIVEIGPGKGILTQYIHQYDYPVYLIELDATLIPYLQRQFPALQDHIKARDVLDLNLQEVSSSTQIAVVGNFPYNISSQIVFWMLAQKTRVSMMMGMFQKEVGKRLAASPGNKDYGVISVLVNAFYHTEYLFDVKPGAFAPPPKVTSGIVRLTRKKEQNIACDETLFKRVVKAAFGQRRKTLRNSLQPFDLSKVSSSFLQRRAEQLSVAEFITITRQLDEFA